MEKLLKSLLVFMLAFSSQSYALKPKLAPSAAGFSLAHAKLLNSLKTSHQLADYLKRAPLGKEAGKISLQLLSMKDRKLPHIKLKNKTLHFKYKGRKYAFKQTKSGDFLLNGKPFSAKKQARAKTASNLFLNGFIFKELFSLLFYSEEAHAVAWFYIFVGAIGALIAACATLSSIPKKSIRSSAGSNWGAKTVRATRVSARRFDKMVRDAFETALNTCAARADEVKEYQNLGYYNAVSQYCDLLAQGVVRRSSEYPDQRQPVRNGAVDPSRLFKLSEQAEVYGIGLVDPDYINQIEFLTCNEEYCDAENSRVRRFEDLSFVDQEVISSILRDRSEMVPCTTQSLYILEGEQKRSQTPVPAAAEAVVQ